MSEIALTDDPQDLAMLRSVTCLSRWMQRLPPTERT